jgi:hypothetical protein
MALLGFVDFLTSLWTYLSPRSRHILSKNCTIKGILTFVELAQIQWIISVSTIRFAATRLSNATYGHYYLPIQNWLKMESSKSSVAVLPTISPTALTAIRKSSAASSKVTSPRNASIVRRTAARARFSAS